MKKTIIFFSILFFITGNALAAGSSSGDTKSNFDQAVKLIKSAKKSDHVDHSRSLELNLIF